MPTEMVRQRAAALRRRATEALAEREKTQRRILDHLSVGVAFADIAGTVFYLNPWFTELFGYTLAQVRTLAAWWPLAHPEPAYREQVIAEWNHRLAEARGAGGEIRPMEVAITCSDGTEKHVRVTAKAIGDGLFVTFIDLAERKLVDDALRASESRYRDFYENSPVAHFTVGPDARIRRCNRQAAKMLAYTIEQLVGRPIFELYADTPHGKPKASQLFRRFLAGEPVADEELQMARADGTLIWISLTVTAVRDAAGAVVESRSTVVDITERKEAAALLEARVEERTSDLQAEIAERIAAQAALERSQASLAEAERMAHLGSWELDPATDELRLSDELRRLYGFRLEASPLTLADLDNAIHPDDRAAVKAARQRALQVDQSHSNQYRIILPGGETRVVHVSGEIRRDATGQPTHAFGMAQDVTERDRIMTELNLRVQELSSLEEFGRVVSLAFPLEEIVRTYLERLVNLPGLDLAQIFLLREGRLHLAGVHTNLPAPVGDSSRCDDLRSPQDAPPTPNRCPLTLEVGECLCGLAVQEGQTVYAG